MKRMKNARCIKIRKSLAAAVMLAASLLLAACAAEEAAPAPGEQSLIVTDGETQSADAAASGETAPAEGEPAAGGGLFGGGMTSIMLIYAGVLGGIYFLMIRPQRKRDKEAKAMLAALTVGDDVITSGGLFGVITAVGEDCFIVEFGTNKGVRVPIRKSDIVAKRAPVMTAPRETDDDRK